MRNTAGGSPSGPVHGVAQQLFAATPVNPWCILTGGAFHGDFTPVRYFDLPHDFRATGGHTCLALVYHPSAPPLVRLMTNRWCRSRICRPRYARGAFVLLLATGLNAQAPFAYGGVGFLSASTDITRSYPSLSIADSLRRAEGGTFDADLLHALSRATLPISLTTGLSESLGLGVVFAFTQDELGTERFLLRGSALYKTVYQIAGEMLLVDFGERKQVLRSVSAVMEFVRVTERVPSTRENGNAALAFLQAQDSTSLFRQVADASGLLRSAGSGQCRVQVRSVAVDSLRQWARVSDVDESLFMSRTRRWIATEIARSWSAATQLPMLPWAGSEAVDGRLALRFADARALQLSIPAPDLVLHIDNLRARKITYGKSAAGMSFVYGIVADVVLQDPSSGIDVLRLTVRNAVTKQVPGTQDSQDDWSPLREALRGLLNDLPHALSTNNRDWFATHVIRGDATQAASSLSTLRKRCAAF
jgi:hypothetical protein